MSDMGRMIQTPAALTLLGWSQAQLMEVRRYLPHLSARHDRGAGPGAGLWWPEELIEIMRGIDANTDASLSKVAIARVAAICTLNGKTASFVVR